MKINFSLRGSINDGKNHLWVNGQELNPNLFNKKVFINSKNFSWGGLNKETSFSAYATLLKITGRDRVALHNTSILEEELYKVNPDQGFENNYTIEIDVFPPFCYFYPNPTDDAIPVVFYLSFNEWNLLFNAARNYFDSIKCNESLKLLESVSSSIKRTNEGEGSKVYRLCLGKLKVIHNGAYKYWKQSILLDDPLEVALDSTQKIIQNNYYFK